MKDQNFATLRIVARELLDLENDIISDMKLHYSFDYGKVIINFKVADKHFKGAVSVPEVNISYKEGSIDLENEFNNSVDIFDTDSIKNMITSFISNLIKVDECYYYENVNINESQSNEYLLIEAD